MEEKEEEKEEGPDDFKKRLAAMLAKGRPPAAKTVVRKAPTKVDYGPEAIIDAKLSIPKMRPRGASNRYNISNYDF